MVEKTEFVNKPDV